MDIAEIRKKARDKGKSVTAAPLAGTAAAQAPTAPERQAEPAHASAAVPAAQDPAPGSEQLAILTSADSALDRLFAVTEEFALATDASYADILDNQKASAQSSQYLAFHLSDEEYALDIKRISEIIKVREFTDIPRSPEFILGIISLRGVVVPIFDLRQRLSLGVSELTPATRIVVCQVEDVTCGLLVDQINQVVNLTDADIEPPPGVLSGLDRDMITGIGRHQGRMIILLNLRSVLDVAFN